MINWKVAADAATYVGGSAIGGLLFTLILGPVLGPQNPVQCALGLTSTLRPGSIFPVDPCLNTLGGKALDLEFVAFLGVVIVGAIVGVVKLLLARMN